MLVCISGVCLLVLCLHAHLPPLHNLVSYIFCLNIDVTQFCVLSSVHPSYFRETNVTKKISVPSAPTGPTTSRHEDGITLTPEQTFCACLTAPPDPSNCLGVTSANSMMSAPSTAPAALRAKAMRDATRVTERLLPAQTPLHQPLLAQQTTRRPAGAPPAVPPQTGLSLWTPLSVGPPHPVEVVEVRPP